MKRLAIAITAVLALTGCKNNEPAQTASVEAPSNPPAAVATETTAVASATVAQPAGDLQTVDIKVSGGDYTPASVTVAKGKPVRLNFTRDEKPTCGDVVVFPTLNIKKKIETGKVTSIDLPAQQAGELKFTCGMNMMAGSVVVQ